MNTINFVLTARELNTAVETFIYTAANQRKELHRIAVAAMLHAQLHGDWRPLARLYTGLKVQASHMRANALKVWIATYSPLHWDEKKQAFRLVKREWNIDAAIKQPFYAKGAPGDGAAEGSKEFDLTKYMMGVVKRGLVEHGVSEAQALDAVRAAYKKVAA